MTHHLNIEVASAEGVLVRVLGMTERRGWRPLAFRADAGEDGDTMELALTVHGDRPIELLIRQLEKLFDVLYIEAQTELQLSEVTL